MAVEDSDGDNLNGHKNLTVAQDAQVVNPASERGRIGQEYGEEGPSKEDKQDSGQATEGRCIAPNNPNAFLDAVPVTDAVILAYKGSCCNGKTVGSHPGDGFDLGTDLLHSNRDWAKVGDNSGNDDGVDAVEGGL